MLIIMTSVFGLMKNSVTVSLTTYEMTDAQESLRTAQEYINRDLTEAGDGLKGISNICVRTTFVTTFLTTSPVTNPCGTGMMVLGLVQSDNNVPANTTVALTNPSVTVRTNPSLNPSLTDRITLLQRDASFVPITLAPSAITNNGLNITVAAADSSRFNVGEIYFINSSASATFATITAKNSNVLTFATGDTYGLNQANSTGPLALVSVPVAGTGTLPTSLMRMKIIHYFVDQNGLLIRRLFGVSNGGLSTSGHVDSVIAEHVVNVQYRYVLDPTSGLATQPVLQLTTPQQQTDVRQVEVTVTAETPHPIYNGARQNISMTTMTSVRNLQFLQALEP